MRLLNTPNTTTRIMKVGDQIETSYGVGQLLAYKEVPGVYEVRLPFGMLYANRTTIFLAASAAASDGDNNKLDSNKKTTMEINDAYEALEKMRRLNLEVTCQEHGFFCVDYERCVTCILVEANEAEKKANNDSKVRFPRFQRLMEEQKKMQFPRIQRLMDEQKKLQSQLLPPRAATPCLICGSPVCSSHTSKTFRAESINVCLDCEQLFNFEFIVDCLTMDKRERREKVDRMIDLYDRTALLLKYSSQYIDGAAASLEDTKFRQNKIGVGGSTAGLMSGALGIAAAATILTPAGPPLLIASLLFGGR
jgi:hypothetical protein